jgi:hypothetical protein
VGAEASGGTPDVTPDPATAGSAGAPDTPIQPGAVGGNPGVGQSGVGQSGVGQPAGPGGSAAGVPGPTPSAVERTIGTVAGTVRVRCVGPTAEIIGWDLLPGVALADVNRGPGPETGIVLNALVAEVRLVVRCRDGVPEHTLL